MAAVSPEPMARPKQGAWRAIVAATFAGLVVGALTGLLKGLVGLYIYIFIIPVLITAGYVLFVVCFFAVTVGTAIRRTPSRRLLAVGFLSLLASTLSGTFATWLVYFGSLTPEWQGPPEWLFVLACSSTGGVHGGVVGVLVGMAIAGRQKSE